MNIELGKIIEGEQDRDAIHIAVAPVFAYVPLNPGEHIGFIDIQTNRVSSFKTKKIGIVDPFLTKQVKVGEQFWMFLYPNTITSLRHDWIHPDFDNVRIENVKARAWITEWANRYGLSYDDAMRMGQKQDFFIGEVCYDNIPEEFWNNFEILTGTKIDEETRETTHFHCAC
jgi:hypothetical protein